MNTIKSAILATGLKLNRYYAKALPAILVSNQYQQGGLALEFISDDEIGEPLARASIWVEEITPYLAPNQFVCKSYAENEGMIEYLLANGLCIPSNLRPVALPYSICPILQLSPELTEKLPNV